MAKISSHIWSTARGSVGGITYFTTPSGQIIARQRTAPVNPNTNRQEEMRGAFNFAATLWVSLSRAQREAWQAYAETCTFVGPQNNYHISGRQMFKRNIATAYYLRNRGLYSAVISSDAPGVSYLMGGSLISTSPLVAPGIGFTAHMLTSGGGLTLAGAYLLRSARRSPTINFYKGPYDSETMQYQLAVQFAEQLDFVFSGLVLGQAYFLKGRYIQEDGDPSQIRLSVPFYHKVIATETAI